MSKPLIDEIEKWVQENPQAGYTCLSDFLHEAARIRFQAVKMDGQVVKIHGPLPKDQATTANKAITTNYDKLVEGNKNSS